MSLLVSVCTWNVDGEISKKDERRVASWLNLQGGAEQPADIHAFGLQELGQLNACTVFGQDGDQEKQQAAILQLDRILGKNYKRVESIGMVGLFLVVYAHHNRFVSDVDGDRVKRGPLGLLGNKGAVCLRLTVDGVRLCFANVHIAAGVGNMDNRLADLDAIVNEAFQQTSSRGNFRAPQGSLIGRRSPYLLGQDEVAVIFGDFNFRLADRGETLFPDDDNPEAWRDSIDFDEGRQWLRGEYGSNDGFEEASPRFGPTYKYRRDDDKLDRRRRRPAWCDRIFVKSNSYCRKAYILPSTYRSGHELKHTSDHRPVAAMIQISPEIRSQPDSLRSVVPPPLFFEPLDVLELQRTSIRLLVLFGGLLLLLPSTLGLLNVIELVYQVTAYFTNLFRIGIGILVCLMAISTLGPAVWYASLLYTLWGRGFFYLFVASLLSYSSEWYAAEDKTSPHEWYRGYIDVSYTVLHWHYRILGWYFAALSLVHVCMHCWKRPGGIGPQIAGDEAIRFAGERHKETTLAQATSLVLPAIGASTPLVPESCLPRLLKLILMILKLFDCAACVSLVIIWLGIGVLYITGAAFSTSFHPLAYLIHAFQLLLTLNFSVVLGNGRCFPWLHRCILRYARIFSEPFGRFCFFLFQSSCVSFESVHIRTVIDSAAPPPYPLSEGQFRAIGAFVSIAAWSFLGVALCHAIEARGQMFIVWRYLRGRWLYRPGSGWQSSSEQELSRSQNTALCEVL